MKILSISHLIFFFFSVSSFVIAQDSIRTHTFFIDGEKVEALITEDDTILISNFNDSVTISSPRHFESREEYLKYMKYKRYAAKVYPYAKDAVKVYRETEYVTKYMHPRTQKKYIKNLESTLKDQFENNIRKMTRTQGYILVEMIERELDMPLFELIKDTRGNFVARYYSSIANFFKIDLRDGYREGEDKMLDVIIDDFDISYDVNEVIERNAREEIPMIPNY